MAEFIGFNIQKIDPAEYFLKKSKQKMTSSREYLQPHFIPRLNLHAAGKSSAAKYVLEELLTSACQVAGFVSTHPVPIGSPAEVDDSIIKGSDPALRLVKNKRQFEALYEKVSRSKHNGLTSGEIQSLIEIVECEPVVDVHPNIVSLAEVCSLDPDPFFSGLYNYYYGNNSSVTELQGRLAVIQSKQDKLSELRVIAPKLEDENVYDITHINHGMEEGVIYQVDCFSDFVLLRQKKSCGLFKFEFEEETSLRKIGVVTTPQVFVSSCLNTFKQNEFATVSPNVGIEIHDVHSKSKRSVDIEGVKDNWGHVHYHDQNVVMFTNRDSISLCDLRDSEAESLQWEVKNQTEVCDNAFAAAKGKLLHYVSTKHYLMSLDVRRGFHQRWPHGLSSAPCLLNVVSNETQNDALLVGCQASGGVVFVQNSPFGDFTSDILSPPMRLPSLRETLHSARTHQRLLSPVTSARFSLSLTGLTSIKRSGSVKIFSCSSAGDLFSQIIRPAVSSGSSVEQLNGVDLERLGHWESQCLQQFYSVNHEFKATRIASLKHRTGLFEGTSDSKDKSPIFPIPSPLQSWNKSKQRLKSFKDVLAPKLLALWNIEEDEWCDTDETSYLSGDIDEDMSGESSDEQDVDTKVQAWLDQNVKKYADTQS